MGTKEKKKMKAGWLAGSVREAGWNLDSGGGGGRENARTHNKDKSNGRNTRTGDVIVFSEYKDTENDTYTGWDLHGVNTLF